MRIWDWALEVYARQPVAAACLNLQDGHGQNVPYLLWAAWAAGEGRSADLKEAARLMRDWDAEIGAPLRGVRRALKPPRPPAGRGTCGVSGKSRLLSDHCASSSKNPSSNVPVRFL